MTITLIILSVVFSVIAHVMAIVSGYAKMICDLSEEGKLNKKPFEYWHKTASSKNKHQYTGKIKAWLMKNLLVMFTDGWHKYESYLTYSLLLAGYFVGYNSGRFSPFYSFLLLVIIGIRMGTFHLFHDTLNILKQDKFHTK